MGMEKGSGLNFGPYDYNGGGENPQPPTPTPQGEYFVKVIDYDGTVIDEQWLDDGAEYTLPSAPSHEGLVFQEWSSSETITDGKITIDKNNVMIGAIYDTASGKNEFDIELTKATELSVTLNMDGTKDWGDGTTDTNTSHTYSDYGKYTIKCDGTTMTTSSSSGLFGQNSGNNNHYVISVRLHNALNSYAFQLCISLKNITIPKNLATYSNSYQLFNGCSALEHINIPSTTTSFGAYMFRYCYALKSVVVSNNMTAINSYAFISCYTLKDFVINNKMTNVYTEVFEYCYSLQTIIPESVIGVSEKAFSSCYSMKKVSAKKISTIGQSAFLYNSNIMEYDFSLATSVPSLSNSSVFSGINKLCKIKVPASLYDSWKTATNWVTYADYIVAV